MDLEDDCVDNPCGDGNGTCTDLGLLSYSCECEPGYLQPSVKAPCIADMEDDCKGDQRLTCAAGGTCVDVGAHAFMCDCAEGYTGGRLLGLYHRCTPDYEDDCNFDPCGIGGTCTDLGYKSFRCDCEEGYKVFNASNKIYSSSALASPCVVTDLYRVNSALTSTCAGEFQGCLANVECKTQLTDLLLPLDSAASARQEINGGRVNISLSGDQSGQLLILFMCALRRIETFAASDNLSITSQRMALSTLVQPSSVCESRPCQHHGQCIVSGGNDGYSCSCSSGWEGQNCEINHDDCDVFSCLNEGRCIDGDNKFSCECASGFAGPTCELKSTAAAVVFDGVATASQLGIALAATGGKQISAVEVTFVQYTVRIHFSLPEAIALKSSSSAELQQIRAGVAASLGVSESQVTIVESQNRRRLEALETIQTQDDRNLRKEMRRADFHHAKLRHVPVNMHSWRSAKAVAHLAASHHAQTNSDDDSHSAQQQALIAFGSSEASLQTTVTTSRRLLQDTKSILAVEVTAASTEILDALNDTRALMEDINAAGDRVQFKV